MHSKIVQGEQKLWLNQKDYDQGLSEEGVL